MSKEPRPVPPGERKPPPPPPPPPKAGLPVAYAVILLLREAVVIDKLQEEVGVDTGRIDRWRKRARKMLAKFGVSVP